MTIEKVKSIVSQGETHFVEFKRKISEPEKIVREMIAFANADGGTLIIGVNDDLSIPGLKFPEEQVHALEEAIKKFARPRLAYSIETIPISRKRSVVVYSIPESSKKPHYIFKNYRKYTYVRKEDRSIQASREMVHIIMKKRKKSGEYIMLGEKEQVLFKYLKEHEKVTLSVFRQIANISKKTASQTLISLVSAGILEVEPHEKEDIFFATELE